MRLFALALLMGWISIACAAFPLGSGLSSGVRVADVLLVPADPSLSASCARAAALGGIVVPCPRLIIQHRGPIAESCPDHDLIPNGGGKDCLEDSAAGDSNLPSRRDAFTYTQNDIVFPGALHLFIVGVKEDSRLAPFRSGCAGRESTESGPQLDGSATTWVQCPDDAGGMNSGHVLLRWTKGNVIYAVSLHGHTGVNREVELAIARNIDYVSP
jgi:hypothetical protein